MKPSPSAFLDLLRRACEADPRAARDAARLLKRWDATGRPPASWTIRWNSGALALFRESVGLDVIRSGFNGGHVIKVDPLCRKLGGVEIAREGLAAFVLPATGGRAGDSLSIGLRQLLPKAASDRSRRWLDALLLAQDARMMAKIDDISWVARALDALDKLAGKEIHCSDLGSRVGASSKYFRPGCVGRRLLADALLHLDGGGEPTDPAREAALENAGVRLSPTAYGVLVAGPLALGEPALDFPHALSCRDQAVMLTLQNLGGARLMGGCEGLLTVENEASFLSAMKEGLHARKLLVATGGFPNRAVLALLGETMGQAKLWLHWGDTDLAGLRIARLMESRLGRSPELFRCAAADIRRLKDRLLPFTPAARREMALDLKTFPTALGADVLRAALAEGGWLEQEAWEPPVAAAT